MAVWVTEARAMTGFGNVDRTWDALHEGRTAIRPIRRFDTSRYGCGVASLIESLEESTSTESLIVELLELILKEGVTTGPAPLVITATTKAGIDKLDPHAQNKRAGSNEVLPCELPALIADKLGLADYVGFNVSAACASSSVAVARAASMIEAGLFDSAVVCAADIVSEFVFSGFSSLKILSERPCRPFHPDRNGLSLGEGAAFFVLQSEGSCRTAGLPCRGVVAGWGISNDAEHIISPAADGRGVASAIRVSLEKAGVDAKQVGAVSAHGTGTVQNDAMELSAFETLFGPDLPPTYSVKGAVGHCLGAAGGIELVLALRALAAGCVPPTVGFTEPGQEPLPHITVEPTAMKGQYLVMSNSGFGGVNCSLVLKRGEP